MGTDKIEWDGQNEWGRTNFIGDGIYNIRTYTLNLVSFLHTNHETITALLTILNMF